jgi:ankyrin repeat protein
MNNIAILSASANGHTDAVRLLLDDKTGRVDPSTMNNDAIQAASEQGHTDVVRLLLADPRVDPTADNNRAIMRASTYNRTEIVRLLLAWSSGTKRVDPAANNRLALWCASWNGHTEIVKLLFQDPRTIPTEYDMRLVIIYTCANQQVNVARLLVTNPLAKKIISNESFNEVNEAINMAKERDDSVIYNLMMECRTQGLNS